MPRKKRDEKERNGCIGRKGGVIEKVQRKEWDAKEGTGCKEWKVVTR